MTNEKKYQYLSIGLGVLALVFAVLYFTKDTSVSDIISSVDSDLENCKQRIEQWQQEHITQDTQEVSQEDKEELNSLLEQCTNTIQQNQNRL